FRVREAVVPPEVFVRRTHDGTQRTRAAARPDRRSVADRPGTTRRTEAVRDQGGPGHDLEEQDAGTDRERRPSGEARDLRVQGRHDPVRHDEPPAHALHPEGSRHLRGGGAASRIRAGYDGTSARTRGSGPRIAARRRNCDGDEDSLILLLDCLINFSRSFLPDKRGGLMDAPLVLTTRIDPNEIDKEAHNLDLPAGYPLALFEAAERFAHPKEVEAQIDTVGKRIGSVLQYEGFAYTHETHGVAQGPLASAYGEGSMAEKIDKQLDLALRVRAVDPNDVVARIVVHHFLPDL